MQAPSVPLLPRDFPGARLRRLRTTDLAAFQAYRSIPELGRYQGWSPMSDADAQAFLVAMSEARLFVPGRWVQLGIAESETDRLIGDIGLHLSEDGLAGEVGFTLEPVAQGRGIATAAVREALDLLFASTSVLAARGVTDSRNLPSVRLLERLGFRCRESRDVLFRGEACTEWVYVLTRDRA